MVSLKFALFGVGLGACLSLTAATRDWVAGADGNWDVGANWTGGVLPGSSDFARNNSGFVITIDSNVGIVNTHTTAGAPGSTGVLDLVNGGQVQISNAAGVGNNLVIGQNGGNGTFTLNGGTLIQRRGSNAVRIGYANGAAQPSGHGTFILNSGSVRGHDGATTQTDNWYLGTDGGRGYMEINGGNLRVYKLTAGSNNGHASGAEGTVLMSTGYFKTGALIFGSNTGGVGTFIMDGGTVDQNSAATGVGTSTFGAGAGGQGTFIMNNGSFLHERQALRLGAGTGSTAYFEMNNGNMRVENFDLAWNSNPTATANINGGTLTVDSELRMDEGNAFLNITGGDVTANRLVTARGLGDGTPREGDGNSTVVISGGSLTVNSSTLAARGNSFFSISNGIFNSGTTMDIHNPGSAILGETSVVTQTGGLVQAGSINFNNTESGVGNGTYNLEGGLLRVDNITTNGDLFNWGGGTISAANPVAASGSTDFSAPGFEPVQAGRTIGYEGNLATGYNGGTSQLDLGGIYINDGNRMNVMTVSGDLDLTATGDVLSVSINPYLLRPFSTTGAAAEEYGSIPLLTVGGDLTGIFDSFLGVSDDGRGFAESAFSVTDATALDVNTWYLEYDTVDDVIWFHYKVAGYVPEPSSFGLLALGACLIRFVRKNLLG